MEEPDYYMTVQIPIWAKDRETATRIAGYVADDIKDIINDAKYFIEENQRPTQVD